jgi:ribosomal-protein-alanine N-acetyltransferase
MIRPLAISDLDSILQIELRSFPKSPYDRATFINLHYLYPETFWVYVSQTPHQRENQILGYVVFSKEGHIISVAVHPLHRRRGIGKELLKRAMIVPHLTKVWAEVRRSNQGAQAFYIRLGFRITGIIPNYYGNEDALIVEKRID